MNYDFAERLIELRRQHDLSQEDLAKDLGVSRQAISKWERAESTPDVTNLVALATLYKISLDELVHGETPATRKASETPTNAADDSAPAGTSAENTTTAAQETATEATDPAASEPSAPQPEAPASQAPEPTAAPTAETSSATAPPPPQGTPYATTPPPPPAGAVPVQPAAAPAPQQPKKHDPLYTFPYPVLVVMIYLFLGFCFGLWHPGWVLFFTIPFYYWIVSVVTHDPNYVARRQNPKR